VKYFFIYWGVKGFALLSELLFDACLQNKNSFSEEAARHVRPP